MDLLGNKHPRHRAARLTGKPLRQLPFNIENKS